MWLLHLFMKTPLTEWKFRADWLSTPGKHYTGIYVLLAQWQKSTQDPMHPGELMQEQQHFLFFPALLPEIWLMICEYTWPEARIIEAATHVDLSGDKTTEWTYLRPGGSLAAFLWSDISWRNLVTKLLLETRSPLALGLLWIMRTYIKTLFTKHSIFPQHSFYFIHFMTSSTYSDLEWNNKSLSDEPSTLYSCWRVLLSEMLYTFLKL